MSDHLVTEGAVSNLKPVYQTKQSVVNKKKKNKKMKLSNDEPAQYLHG